MSRTTLRVFEHETVRVAPGSKTLDGAVVPTDLDLDALARFNDAHEQRYFRMGWRSLTFSEYVGYLQVGDVAFEILPKADRGTPQGSAKRWKKALLAMLRVATGMQLHSPGDADQAFERSSLLDLLARAFLEEVSRLTHEGLARSYRTHEANGTTFRGRLMMTENLRENLVRPDRVYVRFATFDADITINRVLAETLRILEDLPIAPSLRAWAASFGLRFAEVGPLRIGPHVFDRITLGRSTVRYKTALLLARMILDQVSPSLTVGRTQVFAFLFDMNVLWETYVAALFRRVAATIPGIDVSTQQSALFWKVAAAAAPTRKNVRPDIVVRERATNDVMLVVDTKWKLTDGGAPSDDDLKQMFVYNELFASRDAILLYPARSAAAPALRGTFAVLEKHVCRTACLGLFEGDELRVRAMESEVRAILDACLEHRRAAERADPS